MTETTPSKSPLLEIRDLTVRFPTEDGYAFAVNQMDLSLDSGQVLGLVGESGCGKSMTSLAVLGLVPNPGEIAGGSIHFKGRDLTQISKEDLRKIRGKEIALIPQDPLTSLNPVYTIGDQITEVLMLHEGMNQAQATQRAIELLDAVRIPNAKDRVTQYPHEFSGGMRQRVMIAMGISCNPDLLIADEPTTALDVTVQAQILELLLDIQKEYNTAILLITHDLGVVAEVCHEVSVMYAGRLVEDAKVHDLFATPKHPYTQGLLNSLPTMTRSRLEPIPGQPPALTEIPVGCSFEPRCPQRMDVCTTEFPDDRTQDGQKVACYLYHE